MITFYKYMSIRNDIKITIFFKIHVPSLSRKMFLLSIITAVVPPKDMFLSLSSKI